ncbi:MAG: hypothetical protein IT423_22365 [Pirellulaceae bacterium]|nr:hypothetical protein [Pirellulaceae bacterium]
MLRRMKLVVQAMAMMIALSTASAQTAQAQSDAGGGGGDILVFDIIDSVAKVARPVGGGGGGGDIVVLDIVDEVARDGGRSPSGGGMVSEIRLFLLCESDLPGVYVVMVDSGDSLEFGLMWEIERHEQLIKLGLMFKF